MVKTANDLVPTIIVLLIMTLLAVWIVAESNKRQQEIIDTVKQAHQERQKQYNATLEAIRERIGDDEAWQRLKSPLEKSLQESNRD